MLRILRNFQDERQHYRLINIEWHSLKIHSNSEHNNDTAITINIICK